MALPQKRKKCERQINVLDLSENIFREIFSYLKYHVVYIQIRSICRTIKRYVDDYVQLGAIFICISSAQLIHVYKQNKKVVSIRSRSIASNPIKHPGKCFCDRYDDYFNGVFDGKVITGNFTATKDGLWVEGVRRDNKFIGPVFEYNPETNQWQKNLPFMISHRNFQLSWYPIGDKKLLLLLSTSQTNRYNHESNNIGFTQNFTISHEFSCKQKMLPIMQQINPSINLRKFTITRLSHNKVMIIGGEMKNNIRLYNNVAPNIILWQGNLSNDGIHVDWMRINIECDVGSNRLEPLCFKLNDNLYIVGGYSEFDEIDEDWCNRKNPWLAESERTSRFRWCDRYNLKQGTYHQNVYYIPYSVNSDSNMVATDAKETFALIGDPIERNRPLIFTEDEGFTDAPPGFNFKFTPYSRHGRDFLRVK